VFSETRYARNGDLSIAYRASPPGERDVIFIPNWFTCCEVVPELPSLQGWIEAITSLGRLIFLDQPGTGASDPVTPGALPTLEQWGDSILAVLDDLGSREAVLIAVDGAFAPAALFAATHPSRTSVLISLDRAGLHTGECEIRGDDIGGIAVHIGARVSALAGPNDVLVSRTLRDLVIGSGLEFTDRGAHQLKGVPGDWHLFAVAG
jgi:pimeloyl-ACP methyl ester carboxylesterase